MRTFLCAITAGGGLFLALAPFAAESNALETLPPEVLTNAAQIRALPPALSALALPVALTGVVLDNAAPTHRALMLLDQTAGIYALADQPIFTNYNRGDLVEITGVTDPGGFAPIVRVRKARIVGTGPTPEATPVSYQQLITGSLDGQWVAIRGVVRQCFEPAPKDNIRRILVAVDGGVVPVRYITLSAVPVQPDAEVRLQAICYYQYNQKRQVLSPVLEVPIGDSVLVEKPALADPYAIPVRPANSLLQFSPANVSTYAHRIHVRGVVTCSQPGSAVWIRDGQAGLRIQTRENAALTPGDLIDVLGFLSFGYHTPSLENSAFQKTGREHPPAPVLLAKYDQTYDHDDDLVSLDANLAEILPVQDGLILALEKDGKKFKAVLRLPAAGSPAPEWQADSQVRITGICSLIYDEERPLAGIWQPQSFQLLLRSPADLQIIKPPPWWTPRHTILVLGVFVLAALLVAGWLILLSYQRVNEQKHRRAMAESEFAAILSERNRLAREIHDTLAQGLGAISMQLELTKSRLATGSDGAGEHLAQAHQLVRNSLADARSSIWNMRSQVLETGDLASALSGILQQLSSNTGVEGRMQVKGRSCRLPPVTENNLLRIGQEAITNAMKHARSKLIEVELEFADKEVHLRVRDNGCGFDTSHPPASDSGFGLLGMRERVEELNGQLDIRSVAGRGTEIALSLPIPG